MSERIRVRIQPFADRNALQLQWRDPETKKWKTKSAGTADLAEAEQKRADLEYELNHGLVLAPARMTWAAFREAFEREHVAPLRPSSRDNTRHGLDAFERHCPVASLASVNERVLSDYAARLHEAGRAPSTVRERLRTIRTALRWAAGQKLIAAVPVFPRIKVPRRRPQDVPAEAYERLHASAAGETQTLLLCCWLAGLRLSEAMGLEWEPTPRAPWVDFRTHRIWFPAAFVKSTEDEFAFMPPELEEALNDLPRSGPKVFELRARTGGRMTRPGMSSRIHQLARRAGVRLSCHALRRGFICRHARRENAQTVQGLARHRCITTTAEYYINAERAMEEAVRGRPV